MGIETEQRRISLTETTNLPLLKRGRESALFKSTCVALPWLRYRRPATG